MKIMFDIKKIMIIANASIWLSMSMSFVKMIKWLQSCIIWSWVIIAISVDLIMMMIEIFH
jgi:hypothetical protein